MIIPYITRQLGHHFGDLTFTLNFPSWQNCSQRLSQTSDASITRGLRLAGELTVSNFLLRGSGVPGGNVYIGWGEASEIRQKCNWEARDCHFLLCSALPNSLLLCFLFHLISFLLASCFLSPTSPPCLLLRSFPPIPCSVFRKPQWSGKTPREHLQKRGFLFQTDSAVTRDRCHCHSSLSTLY